MRRTVFAIAFTLIGFVAGALGLAAPAAAANVGCMPVTGIFTAVQEQGYINSALFALRTNNRGATAPSDDCSGQPQQGQFWLNTSTSPSPFSIYDGSQQDTIGFVDPTNNLWLPVLGGGVATATAASVTDICQGLPQNEITISGTTPITSFGANCAIGQFKFLKFTGATQIVYSVGSMLTPNGQSFYAENGGRAIVIYLGGGVWDIFSYSAPASAVPLAAIQFTTSTTADPGYVLAYGQSVSTTNCPNAFSKFGYLFGGAGANFNMPDFRGRYIAGQDNMGGAAAGRITNFNAQSIGNTGGAQGSLVDQTHIANFGLNLASSASVSDPGHTHGYIQPCSNFVANWAGCTSGATGIATGSPTDTIGANVHASSDSNTSNISVSVSTSGSTGGGGQPLPILPPSIVLAVEIRC